MKLWQFLKLRRMDPAEEDREPERPEPEPEARGARERMEARKAGEIKRSLRVPIYRIR